MARTLTTSVEICANVIKAKEAKDLLTLLGTWTQAISQLPPGEAMLVGRVFQAREGDLTV